MVSMSENGINSAQLRSVMNDMIELAEKNDVPSVQEIIGLQSSDTLFDYLTQNYSPREFWLSGVNTEVLRRISIQILGAQYEEFAIKLGIKKNGILPIIASLAMYIALGFVD
jgi:hypothetical protein